MSENRMLLDEIRQLKRRLQALETRQEHPGFAASDVARLSQNNTFAGIQTIPNTGLHLLDTNGSHDLIIAPGSNLTADRVLTFTTGDADRTVTIPQTGTMALTNLTLAQFAATTSAQLAGVLSDETGSGAAVFATSPTLVTPILGVAAATSIAASGNVSGGSFGISSTAPLMQFYETDGGTDQKTAEFRHQSGVLSGRLVNDAYSASQNWIDVYRAAGAYTVDKIVFPNGNVGVGAAAPAGKAHIDQASITAGIPALLLDQADISEGFIDFVGTSAASAAGPVSSWTVATIAGFVRCEINGAAYWMPYYNAPTA